MKSNVSMEVFYSIALSSFILLASCTSFPSVNQDPEKNNQATFKKDFSECKDDYPEQSSGVSFRQWIGCMKLKGWR